MFQSSAHPKEDRNATLPVAATYWPSVSILGPPEGRPKPRGGTSRTSRLTCFNPRPTRRKTETDTKAYRCMSASSFNPRPTRRKTETYESVSRQPRRSVFQSSAHPKEDRNGVTRQAIHLAMFQSSAHPKEDRNCRTVPSRITSMGFNPRPTRRKTETIMGAVKKADNKSFNPRPTRRKTETPMHKSGRSLRRPSFNPRPTRRKTETFGFKYLGATYPFQSSAHPKEDRNHGAMLLMRAQKFQSSAHPKEDRNIWPNYITLYETLFQSSAHPKEDRNGLKPLNISIGKAVSILGPPEGRPKQVTAKNPEFGRIVSILGPPEGRPKRLPSPRGTS